MIQLLIFLWAGHWLADVPLQDSTISKNKGYAFLKSIGTHTLFAHAMIHGLTAAVIVSWQGYSQHALLAFLLVGGLHLITDFGKGWQGWPDRFRITQGAKWPGNPTNRGLWGINVDQGIHFLALFATAYVITGGF